MDFFRWIVSQAESRVGYELERETRPLRQLVSNPMSLLEGDAATPILKRRKAVNLIVALCPCQTCVG